MRQDTGRLAVEVATGIGLAIAGAVVGVLASLMSRVVWRHGAVTVPWGLLLGVAASWSVVFLARARGRAFAIAAAAGWIVGVGYLAIRPAGADYIFTQDAFGWGFLIPATVGVVWIAGWRGRPS